MAPSSSSRSGKPRDPRAEIERRRREIDALDRRVLAALERRVAAVRAIGEAKRALGADVLDRAREAAILRRLVERAHGGPLDERAVRAIFRRIIAESRRLERGR